MPLGSAKATALRCARVRLRSSPCLLPVRFGLRQIMQTNGNLHGYTCQNQGLPACRELYDGLSKGTCMALVVARSCGGSSVASPEHIKNVAARLVRRHKAGNQVVAVVSAMGDNTDHLLDLAHSVNPNPSAREMDMPSPRASRCRSPCSPWRCRRWASRPSATRARRWAS